MTTQPESTKALLTADDAVSYWEERHRTRGVLRSGGQIGLDEAANQIFYFTRLGLPLESALLVSFVGAALIMLFSLSGGVAYLRRSVLS